MFAALLLLISSVVGFGGNPDMQSSGQDINSQVKAESASGDGEIDAATHKRRGLNLGLLLFRR